MTVLCCHEPNVLLNDVLDEVRLDVPLLLDWVAELPDAGVVAAPPAVVMEAVPELVMQAVLQDVLPP